MPSATGVGAFASGFVHGAQARTVANLEQSRDAREQERADREKKLLERHDAAYKELADLADGLTRQPRAVTGVMGDGDTNTGAAAASPIVRAAQSGIDPTPQVDVGAADNGTPEPSQPAERISQALARRPAVFSDAEGFLVPAAHIFLKHGMGPEGLAFLERGSKAQAEGAIDAARRLEAGDAAGAVAAFNRSGRGRIVGMPRKLGDGTWEVEVDGQGTHIVDPKKELLSWLSPHDYFATLQRDKQIDQTATHQDRVATETERHNQATEETASRNADLKLEIAQLRSKAGAGASTALMKNLDFLVESGIAADHDDAWKKLRTGMDKPESEAITSLAKNLMRSPGYMGKGGQEKAMTDATKLVRSVRAPGATDDSPSGDYKSADDVRAAFKAGKIDRNTATRVLRGQFGMQ